MSKKWYFYSCIALIVGVISTGFKPYKFENLNWFYVNESDEVLHYTVPTAAELEYTNVIFPQTGKTYAGFKQAIAFKESQGKYHAVNTLGYLGKYQFGASTLKRLNIHDIQLFLETPELQEDAFLALCSLNKWILRKDIIRSLCNPELSKMSTK